MTSQIVLMNSHGVSIASDSAVTISNPKKGDKITFDSVNKIFHMGGKHNLAFVISGNANFSPGGLAWSRVIGMFASKIGDEPLSTVDEYGKRFQRFLEVDSEINDDVQNGMALRSSLYDLVLRGPLREVKEWNDMMNSSEETLFGMEYDWSEAKGLLKDQATDFIRHVEEEFLGKGKLSYEERYGNKWKHNLDRIHEECGKDIEIIAESVCQTTEWFGEIEGCVGILADWISFHISTRMDYTENSREKFIDQDWNEELTTIGIVGFGSSEFAPKMIEISVGPRLTKDEGCSRVISEFEIRKRENEYDRGRLRELCDYCRQEMVPATKMCDECGPRKRQLLSAPAFLKTFAQDSEIQNTLNGIHQEMKFITEPRNISEMSLDIAAHVKADISGIKGIGDKTMDLIDREFVGIQEKMTNFMIGSLNWSMQYEGEIERRQKFREVIVNLPMNELSEFARTMVKLQADICFFTEGVRSVGGQIDVSTITKENGFQWVVNKE